MGTDSTIQGRSSEVTIPDECNLKYIWVAEYSDGYYFPQFDYTGKENLYGDIQQSKLIRFYFLNLETGHKVSINITPDMRLIAFRRHRQSMVTAEALPHEEGHSLTYSLGFQVTTVTNGEERNFKSIMTIDEDGNVQLSNGDVNGSN